MKSPDHAPVPSVRTELPGPRSRSLLGSGEGLLYAGLAADLAPLVLDRKSGYTATDVDGNVFFDLASASASVPLGACREDLIEPAVAAIRRWGNEDSHALASAPMFELARRLVDLAPGSIDRVDIALNGTEAVETAVRLMRRASGRPLVLAFHGGYHGESTATATLGAEASSISAGDRALGTGFIHAPYPNPYRTPFAPPRAGGSGDATVDYIRDELLFHVVDPGLVAGVVIEPILGSGGCIAPPDPFWPALTSLCAEHDWLLCADEVKTGMGRGGTMLAVERWGLEPDLICMGKALGGGVMPIGAVLGNERVLGDVDDLSTGSTWSWLPGSVAAALATLDAYEREDVLGNVAALEALAAQRLGAIADRHERVGDVRAVGCFLAIEFVRDPASKERDPELQEAVARAALERGILADSSTTSLNLQPSLLMPPEALDVALGIVADAVDETIAGEGPR
ncbi:MAG TPA: aminotransferase class III-fold pyridoxal phosphate-dependent enzyme [Solirubrobacterales bacterium]|nr:aminotransferase class III-fold pyridoxal phosphate-dependent enzyme [Solirubrobacterales bacterium]